jgi:hypothetical protein
VNAQTQTITPTVKSYETEGGESYYMYYYPGYGLYDFYPYYYSTYSSSNKVPVTISVEGFPSEYSSSLKVDDSSAGTIPGGGTIYIEVNWRVGHTFLVQSYVEGAKGERFYCPANSWYLEKFSQPGRDAKAANTFQYTTQDYLTISSPYGDATKNSGWYGKGSAVSLSTEKTVDIAQGERDVFDGWIISGSSTRDATVNVVLDAPKEAKAEYHKEYYLGIRSDYGNPSGTRWYKEGSTATIQVDKVVPMEGLAGALGGKIVFNGWSGGALGSNVADVYLDSPKTAIANWREDYSMPYAIILIIVIILVALFLLHRRGILLAKEKPKPETIERGPEVTGSPLDIIETRYAKGDITREEYLNMKKDLEKSKRQ